MSDTPNPTPGRIVLYVLGQQFPESLRGQVRPAIVVGKTNDMMQCTYPAEKKVCQLHVFLDGLNDVLPELREYSHAEVNRLSWQTSVEHDQDGKAPGTWHWMDYQVQTVGTRYPDAPVQTNPAGSPEPGPQPDPAAPAAPAADTPAA